jgi:hypothetical protein
MDQSAVEMRLSPSGGMGVFARKAFRRGETIGDFDVVREITPAAPLSTDDDPDHAYWADGKQLLVGAPSRYLNHSCDPNAYIHYGRDGITIIAYCDIAQGTEITLDYLINTSGGSSWPCRCGAARCRGETGHSFFELPEAFQAEYRPLLAAWFVKRHVARLSDVKH